MLEERVEQTDYLTFKERCAVIILQTQGAYEIVLDLLQLLSRWFGRAYRQLLVDLSGIGIDDGNVEMPGDVETELCLTDSSRACNNE